MAKRPSVYDIAAPLAAAMSSLTKDGKPPAVRYGATQNFSSQAAKSGGSMARLWSSFINGTGGNGSSDAPLYDHHNNVIYLPQPKMTGYTANEENLLRAVLGSQIAGATFKVADNKRPNHGGLAAVTTSVPDKWETRSAHAPAGFDSRARIATVKQDLKSGKRQPTHVISQEHSSTTAQEDAYWKEELALRGVESAMVNAKVAELWPGYEVALRQGWKAILRNRRVRKAVAAKNMGQSSHDRIGHDTRHEGTAADYAAMVGAGLNGLDLAEQSRRFGRFKMDELADMAMKVKSVLQKLGVEGKPPMTENECVDLAKKVLEELDQPQQNPQQDGESDGEGEGEEQEGEGQQGSGIGDATKAPNISDLVGKRGESMNPDFTDATGDAATGDAGGMDDDDEDPDNPPRASVNFYSEDPCTTVRCHNGRTPYEICVVPSVVHYDQIKGMIARPRAARPEWANYILEVDNEVGVMAQMFRQAIRSPQLLDDSRHQVGRFDVRQIARAKTGNRDVFTRRTYLEGDEVAVGILVDGSSSMSSYTRGRTVASSTTSRFRYQAASRTANILASALVRNEMECAIWQYSTSLDYPINVYHQNGWLGPNDNPNNDNGVIEVKGFGSGRRGLEAGRLALLGGMAHGGTPTAGATFEALNEMARRPESRRILFVMTDGDVGGADSMKAQMARAEDEGVDLVVVGIDLGEQYDKQMVEHFGHRYVSSYGDEGPQVMARAISDILLRYSRRAAR